MSDKIFKRVAAGIYRHNPTGRFYERPRINGRPTWRKLHSHNVTLAKEELAARRSDYARSIHGLAKDPYRPKDKTIGQLCVEYQKAGCPDRNHRVKKGKPLEQENYRIGKLLPFWNSIYPAAAKPRDCAKYFAYRKKEVVRGTAGRSVDMEIGTLSNILNWAVSLGKIDSNPFASGRPKFRDGKQVKHCRESMPVDGDELHALAACMFEDRRSEPLGWQLLIEAMTGCRTSEVLRLRWDARHRGEAGFIEGDWLWLNRAKGGVKPFTHIHPALAQCLDALKRWHLWRFPKSPWFIPSSREKGQPMGAGALTHRLADIGPIVAKAHRTSHGLRAYYVTVRRSMGISDAQIADEIGDKSGASIIVSTYGSVPPNWRGATGLSWMPANEKPAWEVLEMPENLMVMPNADDFTHGSEKTNRHGLNG